MSSSEFQYIDFSPIPEQTGNKHDSPFEFTFEDHFEEFHNNIKKEMDSSGSPYIKPEPNDFFNMSSFTPNQQHAAFNNMNQFNNGQGQGQVDPSQLGQGMNIPQSYGQNMSGSFVMGNAGIADDELADLAGSLDGGQNHQSYGFNQHMAQQGNFNSGMNGRQHQQFQQPQQQQRHQSMNSMYSSTPEGAPIQSPFVNHDGFNYAQFRSGSQLATSGGFANSVMRNQHIANMERKISESRSPASPNTPGINGLHIGDPEYPVPMQQQVANHRHSASMSNNWDSTPSGHSWGEQSPFASPTGGHQMQHPQITEVLRSDSNQVASSLPTKMEPGVPGTGYQTQEAKKRRRRESHNLVERRRRDNINERIHDLAILVPQHRLEDEKVRKHLQTNSPLSPSITAASMSPPGPSSLLSSSAGRRSGGITQGLPIEDKDKGPNKGDILNSSVAWARDVMWYLQLKLEQEVKLQQLVQELGGVWPFEVSDDERRMNSEMMEVLERNMRNNNVQPYSRADGTGLRVPGFTNLNGDVVQGGDQSGTNSGQGTSPDMHGNGNGGHLNQGWPGAPETFKEEDEFDDEMLQ